MNAKKIMLILQNVGLTNKCLANLISMISAQRAEIRTFYEPYLAKFAAKINGTKMVLGDLTAFVITELTNEKAVSNGKSNVSFFTSGENDGMKLAIPRTGHTSIRTLKEMVCTNGIHDLGKLKSAKKVGNSCELFVDVKAINQTHMRKEKCKKNF